MAEMIMGRALKRLDWPRHTYVVSTKIFWGWGGTTPNSVGLSRKHVVEGTRAALERLQVGRPNATAARAHVRGITRSAPVLTPLTAELRGHRVRTPT